MLRTQVSWVRRVSGVPLVPKAWDSQICVARRCLALQSICRTQNLHESILRELCLSKCIEVIKKCIL